MTRSNYMDDGDIDQWASIRWRGAVKSAASGSRGQAFFRDLITALDAIPEKTLIADELEVDGQFCALGAVASLRGLSCEELNSESIETVSQQLNIADALAREVTFINDEAGFYNESEERRWQRVRQWAEYQLKRSQLGAVK
jgi:hypothetical protein